MIEGKEAMIEKTEAMAEETEVMTEKTGVMIEEKEVLKNQIVEMINIEATRVLNIQTSND